MPACGIPDNEGSGSVFPEPAAIVKNVSNNVGGQEFPAAGTRLP
jgi:hypothetical protein